MHCFVLLELYSIFKVKTVTVHLAGYSLVSLINYFSVGSGMSANVNFEGKG